jgi:hypothetical protein
VAAVDPSLDVTDEILKRLDTLDPGLEAPAAAEQPAADQSAVEEAPAAGDQPAAESAPAPETEQPAAESAAPEAAAKPAE